MSARVPMIAVNIEVMMPIINVIEKPFIAPVPREYNTTATMRVVKFASQIVRKALS